MMGRRDVLKLGGATGTLTAMAGCLGWISGSGSDDDTDDEEETEQPENENGNAGDETNTNEEADPGGDTNENEPATDESGETQSNETEEGEEPEVHNESELHPDENETQHTGEYNASGGMRETEPRTRDAVEITDESATMNDRGGVTMTATITNTSRESIDAIDIYVEYTVRGEYAYGDSVVVRNLGAGASPEFTSTAPPSRVGGVNPDDLGVKIVEVKPYDYSNSGE